MVSHKFSILGISAEVRLAFASNMLALQPWERGTRVDSSSNRVVILREGCEALKKMPSVAVLAGNGLSISCNQELQLQDMTEAVNERLRDEQGDLASGFHELANTLKPGEPGLDDDFEALIGIFDDLDRYLEALKSVSVRLGAESASTDEKTGRTSAVDSLPREDEFRSIQAFVERLRRTGISHVLEVTHQKSRGLSGRSLHIRELLNSLLVAFETVNIANLNYDTILLACALNATNEAGCKLSDMGKSFYNKSLKLDEGSESRQLRYKASHYDESYESARLRLLHLHGSMTFWENRSEEEGSFNRFAKVRVETLSEDWWANTREEDSDLRPAVILANAENKDRLVQSPPFNAAYAKFKTHLEESSKWIIVGYSFRDSAVNQLLGNELRNKLSSRPDNFRLLVSDVDPRIDTKFVASQLGIEERHLKDKILIQLDGVEKLIKTQSYKEFISSP